MAASNKSPAFREGSGWTHRVKILQPDGSAKYSKRGGFATREEAEQSYYKYEEAYLKAYRTYYAGVHTDFDFKEYLIYWLEEIYTPRVENTTKILANFILYDLLIPNMNQSIKLKYVNAEYLDALLEVVSKAFESAGNKGRELLNIALKDAVEQGYIKNNPVPMTKPYKRKKPCIQVLSKEKLKFFLSKAADSSWYLEILLALFCGLRKGEIYGLKFSDFDMERGVVEISRQVTSNPIMSEDGTSYQVTEKLPKTENSSRRLRVPEAVMKELRKRREKIERDRQRLSEEYVDEGYISCRENGLPHSMAAFNSALTRLCSRNGLPHVTVHGLRHMYATILAEQGVPLVKISALLGHSSIHLSFEYYIETMDENDRIMSFMNANFVPGGGDEC